MITVDIFSDPICPWCYIGWKSLSAALKNADTPPSKISWRPFQLNPGMPVSGMNRRDYLEQKFGGADNAFEAYKPVSERAVNDALDLNLHLIDKTPNTLNAHRLIHWADIEDKQTAMLEGLFDAYFVRGQDIGDPDVLESIAGSAGLDSALFARLLKTDADIHLIQSADETARNMGVSSVPTFIINQYHVITGARDTAFWIDVLKEIDTSDA